MERDAAQLDASLQPRMLLADWWRHLCITWAKVTYGSLFGVPGCWA